MNMVNCGINISEKPELLRYEVHKLKGNIKIDGKWDNPQ